MLVNLKYFSNNLVTTAKITDILAASWEEGLMIGQFLVCPAMSQPIRRDQVGALVRLYWCFHIIYYPKLVTWTLFLFNLCFLSLDHMNDFQLRVRLYHKLELCHRQRFVCWIPDGSSISELEILFNIWLNH